MFENDFNFLETVHFDRTWSVTVSQCVMFGVCMRMRSQCAIPKNFKTLKHRALN